MDISDEVNDFIIAIDPFANEIIGNNGSARSAVADECRKYIRRAIDPAISDTSLTDANADNKAIQKLQNAEFFLWHGHGGYDSKFNVHLCTGEKIDSLASFMSLSKGGIAARSAAYGTRHGDYLAVNAEYFREDTDFTLVKGMAYLAACESGANDTLADALREKGAETVFVNRGEQPIGTAYDEIMMQSIIKIMSGGDDNIFHTAREALTIADTNLRGLMFRTEHFSWPQNASFEWDGDNNCWSVCNGVYVDIVGEEDYTLIPGIKGRVVDESASGARETLSPDMISRIEVLADGEKGRIFEDGSFYIDQLTPNAVGQTYTVEIIVDEEVVKTIENVAVQSNRYTDIGEISVKSIDWKEL